MNRIWMAAITAAPFFVGTTASAGDAAASNGPVLRARLKGALGSRWSVELKNGAVVAKRMRRQSPGVDTKSQIDEQEAKLRAQRQAMPERFDAETLRRVLAVVR